VNPKGEIYGHNTTMEYWEQHVDHDIHKRFWLGSPMLELGGGTGEKAVIFARAGIEVYSLDISDFCLAHCARHKADEPLEVHQRLRFIQHDITEKLPFGNRFFMSVFSSDVLEHLPSENNVHFFEEIHRVLHSAGRALVIVPDGRAYYEERHLQFFSAEGLENLAWHMGFGVVTTSVQDSRVHLVLEKDLYH